MELTPMTAGYIAYDRHTRVVYAVGSTPDEAEDAAVGATGVHEIIALESKPATAALLELFQQDYIWEWGELYGVACTKDEEDTHHFVFGGDSKEKHK